MSERIAALFGRGPNGHDHKLSSDRPVFWVGVAGLVLTCLFAVWFGSQSHDRLEARILGAAEQALANGGHDWAQATAHGQRIALTGAAPEASALAGAVGSVRSALGSGGVFSGGVTKVTSIGVDIVPVVSPFAWSAVRDGRQITLEGVAPSRASLQAIEAAAREQFGVTNVISRMSLGSGAPPDVDWSANAIASLDALNRLEGGSAELLGSSLVVTGSTADEDIAETVRTGLGGLNAGAEVTAFISGPAEWSARLAGGDLTFSGAIASAEARENLSQIARDFFSAEFTDNSRVGAAGPWSERMRVVLPHFARFQSGQIDVLVDQIRIRGLAPASALSFLREDMAGFQDSYAISYDVTETTPEIAEIAGVNLDAADPVELQASCQEGFTQIMSANQILFESASARIDRESGETLDKLIAVMRRCSSLRIEVQGHTDATGRASANRELSSERANAVRTYFIDSGIAAGQLSAVGYGEEQPVASNRNAAGRAQNRRIEFQVSSAEDAQ